MIGELLYHRRYHYCLHKLLSYNLLMNIATWFILGKQFVPQFMAT